MFYIEKSIIIIYITDLRQKFGTNQILYE